MRGRDKAPGRQVFAPGGESGSATIWVLAVGGLVLTAGLVAGSLSTAVLTRHRAEAAADLAALAAADAALSGPRAACLRAGQVAALGAGQVVRCTLADGVAEVVVALRGPGWLARLPPVLARSRAGPDRRRPVSDGRASTGR